MIGLLIITHCQLAKEIVDAAEFITGPIEAVEYISIETPTDSKRIIEEIKEKVKTLDQGNGILVLTDMFGGTPSNLALSFLRKGSIEVVTGINLPMVIAVAHNRKNQDLEKIAETAKNAGRRSISLASELLTPKDE